MLRKGEDGSEPAASRRNHDSCGGAAMCERRYSGRSPLAAPSIRMTYAEQGLSYSMCEFGLRELRLTLSVPRSQDCTISCAESY